jgi:asparagine synthase (glutamine-hydrolysing)
MAHRGPDDFGIESFEINNHRVQFGHRRLAIVDLSSAGHQPMISNCKNYSIIFNGEIYNHLELRSKLSNDIEFKGHSDTETILYYLKTYGAAGIKDFNGIFAIAFIDRIEGRLYLARDPFGVKPLYYCHFANRMFFSSEVKALNSIGEKPSINKHALAELLRLRYNPAPDTLYEGIMKLQPGHCLEIDLEPAELKLKITPFITQVYGNVPRSLNIASDQYGIKVEEAVNRQLLSDVEIGILLSGGLDSAVIAALAQRNSSRPLKAFTIGFEGNFAEDEIEDAAQTASLLGICHHYKRITFEDYLGTIKECIRIVEEPLATTSLIPMYFLCELASRHVKVVLTGQGADEPLGGYFRYKSELIRSMFPAFAGNAAAALISILNIKNEKLLRGAHAMVINDELTRFLAAYEVFSETEIGQLISFADKLSSKRLRYFYDLLQFNHNIKPVERMMALDARSNLADDLLNYTDKISMHFSLECRVPMLDLELVKFIQSLPVNFKLNIWGGKLIHKRYARTILPSQIVDRKKKSFQSPTVEWFKNDLGLIKDMLLESGTPFSRCFSLPATANILKQHKQGYNKEKQIFLLLSLFFWTGFMEESTN